MSARPEVLCVAISFILYVLWDAVGYAIRQSDLYAKSPESRDVPRRRYVTMVCAGVAVIFGVCVWLVDPGSKGTIVAIDLVLVALVLVFRFTKELQFVTPDDAYRVERKSS